MKSPKKDSFNARRKREYAAQADASSRNQTALDKPVIGHFETVTTKLVEMVVTKTRKMTNAQQRGRQERAWARCKPLREKGAHVFDGPNCRSCGCPQSEIGTAS